jgi:hypothetical protein
MYRHGRISISGGHGCENSIEDHQGCHKSINIIPFAKFTNCSTMGVESVEKGIQSSFSVVNQTLLLWLK